MKPSQDPSPLDAPLDADGDLSQVLAEVERSLQDLKSRLVQVEADEHRQRDLQQRLREVKSQSERDRSPTLRAELKQLQRQLDEVELALESRLFSWKSLQNPFWQAVRFGGIGIVLGWFLKSLVG